MACGGDKKTIVGCWKLVNVELDAEGKNQEAIKSVKEQYEAGLSDSNLKICFNEDGTFTSSEGGRVSDEGGTYTVNGDMLTVSFISEGKHTDLLLSLSGNTLRVGQDITERIQAYPHLGIEEGDISKAIVYEVFEREE